jgi:hypothetical protein
LGGDDLGALLALCHGLAVTARMIAPVAELPLRESDWDAREWRLAAMMVMVISIG